MSETKIEDGIWETPDGRRRAVAQGNKARKRKRFGKHVPLAKIRAWRERTLRTLEAGRPVRATTGTLSAAVVEYLRDAQITPATKKVRTQQFAWWCAQAAAVGAQVLTPSQVRAGERGPGQTLGEIARTRLDPKRLRECLYHAFMPTDELVDPTEFASTSNSYRTALFHLFTVLDQDDPDAPRNPLEKVSVRPQAGAQASGLDMRIVAEILKHVPSKFGPSSAVTQARIGVLAWVHITPKQLKQLEPLRDFHDVPDATREDQIAGIITLTKGPRLKGRKGRKIPAPETIPLTPYGVAPMRVFAALPAAWGTFSVSVLNRVIKRAAARAQAALATRGVFVDLSGFTLYHLKHSLATAASVASGGVMTRQGVIKQAPGVQRMLDHTHGRTTAIYTQAAVDPIVRQVSAATALHLDRLFKIPLTAPAALRIVGQR